MTRLRLTQNNSNNFFFFFSSSYLERVGGARDTLEMRSWSVACLCGGKINSREEGEEEEES